MPEMPFRPTVSTLEERLNPAVTPTQVYSAISSSITIEQIINDVGSTLQMPRGAYAQQYLIAVLPSLAVQSQQNAQVLGEFRMALQNQIAANPNLTTLLGPYVAATQQNEVLALLNANYANLYAQGFYTNLTGDRTQLFPPLPPVTSPPPVTSTPGTGDQNTDTPTDPDGTDDSGTDNPDPGTSDPDSGSNDGTLSTTIPDVNAPQWQTQSNGLKIWDVVTGTGDLVQPGNTVTVDYIGWTTDGNSFDSSISRGTPSTFSLNGVIQGWQQGIPGMREGGIRRLYIPAALAYGSNPPAGSSIPPNADLVFEVKMISVP